MSSFNFEDHTHRRKNILTGDWILVSPHRSKRPWQGQVEDIPKDNRPEYDPKCYLCPGNERIGGEINPNYESTFIFENDFAALTREIPSGETNEDELFVAKSERGFCKVICFSPRHDLTLPLMEVSEIEKVITLWTTEYTELSKIPYINHVQIFENKGAMMGCSNPHPHGQIWAQENLPTEVEKKDNHQRAYFSKHGKSLLGNYLTAELKKKERIIIENEHFIALVPFWAVWPYETMIAPKRQIKNLEGLTSQEKTSFAQIIKELTIKYDNIFNISFPYSMGIHQAPLNGEANDHWHFHMSFYPPLLRSATVKKFMVGYEMFGNPQRDVTAEWSAKVIRDLPSVHYSER